MKAFYLETMAWSPGLPGSEHETAHGLPASASICIQISMKTFSLETMDRSPGLLGLSSHCIHGLGALAAASCMGAVARMP